MKFCPGFPTVPEPDTRAKDCERDNENLHCNRSSEGRFLFQGGYGQISLVQWGCPIHALHEGGKGAAATSCAALLSNERDLETNLKSGAS